MHLVKMVKFPKLAQVHISPDKSVLKGLQQD